MPSTRFLGRKVYLLAVIFLAAAMRQGRAPRSMRELRDHFGADRRTIARWQVFWREHFPQTRFWKVARASFARAIDDATLPPPPPTQLGPSVEYDGTCARKDQLMNNGGMFTSPWPGEAPSIAVSASGRWIILDKPHGAWWKIGSRTVTAL